MSCLLVAPHALHSAGGTDAEASWISRWGGWTSCMNSSGSRPMTLIAQPTDQVELSVRILAFVNSLKS
jgi:hypothetical protein